MRGDDKAHVDKVDDARQHTRRQYTRKHGAGVLSQQEPDDRSATGKPGTETPAAADNAVTFARGVIRGQAASPRLGCVTT